MKPLSFEFGKNLNLLREEPGEGSELRLPVLICLISHSNTRERCWPKRETIAKEIGAYPNKVSPALQWLFEHGAIYNVPYSLRVDDEASLHPSKYVFQLTGYLRAGDEVIPYYVPNPEHDEADMRNFQKHGGERAINILLGNGDFPELWPKAPQSISVKDSSEVEPEEVDLTSAGEPAEDRATVPAVAEQPSAIDEIPRIKRDEIRGESEDDHKKRLPETGLGRAIVSYIGAKYLTKTQEDQLSVEYTVVSERKGEYKISPIELYETEPLFGEYIKMLATRFKEQLNRSGSRARVSQTRMLDALTTGGGHGSRATHKTLQDAVNWIETHSAPGITRDERSVEVPVEQQNVSPLMLKFRERKEN
jgi:hypothetical protein